MSLDSTVIVRTFALRGIEAVPVDVGVQVSGGVPGLSIAGVPDAVALDARSRIRFALRAGGYGLPLGRHVSVLVSPHVSPGMDLPGLDLPVIVGILAATGQVPSELAGNRIFSGTVSLCGEVRAPRGMVPAAVLARELGAALVGGSSVEPVPVDGVEVLAVRDLADLRRGPTALEPRTGSWDPSRAAAPPPGAFEPIPCDDVAKLAMAASAAGGHPALLVADRPSDPVGPALAEALRELLPDPGDEDRLRPLAAASVADDDILALAGSLALADGDLRAPAAGLLARPRFERVGPDDNLLTVLGGGRPVMPGKATLACGGVLCLEGIDRMTPTLLREVGRVRRAGEVRITRADGAYRLPATFHLVATAALRGGPFVSPHGFAHSQSHRYDLAEALGVEMVLPVGRGSAHWAAPGTGLSTAELRDMVACARELAAWRAGHGAGTGDRSLARTVADLHGSAEVLPEHVAVADSLAGAACLWTPRVDPSADAVEAAKALRARGGTGRESRANAKDI